MSEENINIALNYYKAMHNKDAQELDKYLHPQVEFLGPIAKLAGKEAVLEAAKRFMSLLNNVTVRAKFASGNQVMLVYDTAFPDPIGNVSAACLMNFTEGLIARIELFFDTRPFDKLPR